MRRLRWQRVILASAIAAERGRPAKLPGNGNAARPQFFGSATEAVMLVSFPGKHYYDDQAEVERFVRAVVGLDSLDTIW